MQEKQNAGAENYLLSINFKVYLHDFQIVTTKWLISKCLISHLVQALLVSISLMWLSHSFSVN